MTITQILHVLASLVAAYVTFISFKDLSGTVIYLNRFTRLVSDGEYAEIANLPKQLLIALGAVFGSILLGFFYDFTLTVALLVLLAFLSTKKTNITFNKNEVFVLTLIFAVYFAGCILT